MAQDVIILLFLMLSGKPAFHSPFSPSSRGSFSFSPLTAIRMVSSAYLRLLLFLPTFMIPTCDSPNLACHMIYPAFKLNKQSDNIQPWCTPFPVLNQSIVPCLVLTVASWPAYRVLRTLKISQFYHLFVCCCIFVNMLAMFQTYLCRVKQ